MAARAPAVQWLAILALSLLFAGVLEAAALPAALLIGPMFAGILAGTGGATVRVPRPAFAAAQSIVGCLVAASISPGIFPVFLAEWPLFLGAVTVMLLAPAVLGGLIGFFRWKRWAILSGEGRFATIGDFAFITVLMVLSIIWVGGTTSTPFLYYQF